jgi:hypothetical protein
LFRLYKRDEEGRLLNHEAWSAGPHIVEHWGVCGDYGETKDHPVSSESDVQRTLQGLENAAYSKGYEPILEGDTDMLVVEYAIEGHGSTEDLDRRYVLEDGFNNLIGWLGLGELDGGSIGSGTMEVALTVVDFDIAKTALERNTIGTDLAGFTRIYREE